MTHTERSPNEAVATFLVAAVVVTMGYVLQWTHGHYLREAIPLVGASLVFALVALTVRARFPLPVTWLVGGSIAAQLYLMTVTLPTIEMTALRAATDLHWFFVGVAATGVLAGSALGEKPPLPRAWFPLVVAIWVAMAALVLKLAPNPVIDVFTVEIDSIKALFAGQNPYAITFPNPYGDNSPFFPPGVSVNGRLQFGFVYPPLALLLCIPGYVAFGDPRYSMLAAMAGAALLMGYARPGAWPKLIAVLFLFTPRAFFVLDRAWTDSFVVLLTALVAFVAIRFPKYLFVAAGLYLALKQHMFIGVPALLLLVPRPMKFREVMTLGLKAGAVGLAVTLPFVAWGPGAFANSVLNIREVFRTDSLGLLAHLANQNVARLSKWSGLIAIVPVWALVLWRAPRTPAGFALAAGATHFMLYFFSTHSFCNEYYNVLGSLCVGLAVWGAGPVVLPSQSSAQKPA
jgi:hypothetical protein